MSERKSIRFKPDPMTLAYIEIKSGRNFSPSIVGLVVNESYSGCALVLATDVEFKKDMKIKIKVGNLNPMKAQVAWVKHLEENIHKVGVKLLE